MSALSLMDVLPQIPDPRSRHGRRHPLGAMLGLVVFGLLRGCQGLEAIAQAGRDFGTPLAHALGFRRGKTPAKSTLSRFLRRLDPAAVEAALTRWIGSRLPPTVEALALDGKTARGSRDGDIPGQHLVSAYAPQAEAVLAQMRVDAKTNEHKAALQLLGILPLEGRVVTGDALFCQRDICQKVVDGGGDYLFTVKDNQPGLAADITAGLGFEAAAFSPGGPGGSAAGAGRPHGEQGARPHRAAGAAGHHGADAAPALAGAGAGV
jgi:hypothetical protein